MKGRQVFRGPASGAVSLALAGLALGAGGARGQQGSPPPARDHAMQPPRQVHAPPDPSGTVGPELSAMAGSHPPEFFAESIINPAAGAAPAAPPPGGHGDHGR